jgi:hypothetical protein
MDVVLKFRILSILGNNFLESWIGGVILVDPEPARPDIIGERYTVVFCAYDLQESANQGWQQ